MKMFVGFFIVVMSFGLKSTFAADPHRGSEQYHFEKEISVAGDGGWDYLSVDEAARKLYVAHGDQVAVIDLSTETSTGAISDTPGVHGFAIVPDLGVGFSSNGKEGKVSVVELKTLKTLNKINVGENPDAIIYTPDRQEVYVFNGKSNSASVIDAKSKKVVATIPLPGKPEFAAADPNTHQVFVNIEDKSEVVVIDVEKHRVVSTWPVAPGDEPTGLSIDLKHHHLFIGCHNKLMIMMDSTSGKILDKAPIAEGVDATWFDPKTDLAFSSNGSGSVNIFQVIDKLSPQQTLVTRPRARTMAFDSVSRHIYLADADFDAPRAGENRGQQKPGTFKILAFQVGQ